MSSNAVTLDWKVMKYSADSVEWCPISEFHNILVCGTYQLNDNNLERSESDSMTTSRLGCICLFEVNQGLLGLIQSVDTPGVLDMKWCPYANFMEDPILAIANAEGEVLIFILKRNAGNSNSLSLTLLKSFKCVEKEGILALSLDWAAIDNTLHLVVSDSKGKISLLKMTNSNLEKIRQWNAHTHEAWITTFDKQNQNIVYSGGDDCRLVVCDVRQQFHLLSLKKEHDCGVTSLSCNEDHNSLASGSYDEQLRLWDKRNWKSPVAKMDLGGGVWKIKWEPHVFGKPQNNLLAACMHAGFKMADCTRSWDGGSVSSYFTYAEHGSLAYGCDWCHSKSLDLMLSKSKIENLKIKGLMATCSFYDCKLSLWLLH